LAVRRILCRGKLRAEQLCDSNPLICRIAMSGVNDGLNIIYLGMVAGLYLRPEHAIFNSQIVTDIILFGIVTALKLIYRLGLYPEYFSPVKDIHSPPVRQITLYPFLSTFPKSDRIEHGSQETPIPISLKLHSSTCGSGSELCQMRISFGFTLSATSRGFF
jgi:hypothetical protein